MKERTDAPHDGKWRPEMPPDIEKGVYCGRMRGCAFCGSMHPSDVAAAIQAGARVDMADMKYGWPHKFYVDGVPNPFAGMLESRRSQTHLPEANVENFMHVKTGFFDPNTGEPTYEWREKGRPAPATTFGKFYTIHLIDATPEEKEVIWRAIGMRIRFTDDDRVYWERIAP